jgi:hypothetical protein
MVQSVYNTYSLYPPTDLIMAVETVMLSYQNMKKQPAYPVLLVLQNETISLHLVLHHKTSLKLFFLL